MVKILESKKINSIEALRFIFMTILVSHHGGFNFTKHGYLVVEFFFMLSGYLIYNSFIKHGKSTIDYTLGKLKRTYIEYAIVCIVMFILFGVVSSFIHGKFTLEVILKLLPELLLLQNIGIFDGGYNSPLWYYSVLIWGGGGIYLLIKYKEEFSVKILLPLIILITYSYIFYVSDNIESWKGVIPLLRGVAGMSIGVLLYYFRERIIIGNIFCNIIGCMSFILYITIMIITPFYDKYSIIFIPCILLCAFNENSILNKTFKSSIWSFLGSITFEMYILHSLFIYILKSMTNFLNINIAYNVISFIILLFVLCLFSYLFKQFCKRINLLINHDKII